MCCCVFLLFASLDAVVIASPILVLTVTAEILCPVAVVLAWVTQTLLLVQLLFTFAWEAIATRVEAIASRWRPLLLGEGHRH